MNNQGKETKETENQPGFQNFNQNIILICNTDTVKNFNQHMACEN